MARVYISVGSNIEPLHNVRAGLIDMQQYFGTLTLSSVYESQAVGFEGDNFYNLVVGFNTAMEVYQVARTLRHIEQAHGRQRHGERFSARTLDLDLLLYEDLILKDKNLEVPRHEIMQYAFVLLPLAEIAPDAKHPLTGQRYVDIAHHFDSQKQPLWRIAVDIAPSKPPGVEC